MAYQHRNSESDNSQLNMSFYSEFAELDEEALNLSKKLQEKDQLIEELNKKIRYLEFGHKQQLSEKRNKNTYSIQLNAEIRSEKTKNSELKQQIDENKIINIAKDLEKRLSEKENELLTIRENELHLKKELFNLKKNLIDVKSENERNMKTKDDKPMINIETVPYTGCTELPTRKSHSGAHHLTITFSPNAESTTRFRQTKTLYEKSKSNVDIEAGNLTKPSFLNEELLDSLKKSKEEIERLEEQLVSVKDMAVEAIVEKEQKILELTDKVDRLESSYSHVNEELRELQEKQLKNFSFKRMSQDEYNFLQLNIPETGELNQLRIEYQNLQEKYNEETAYQAERIQVLNQTLEREQVQHEEKIWRMQQELNEKMFEKIQDQAETAKMLEANLLNALHANEEKLRNCEKEIKDLRQQLTTKETTHNKEVRNLNKNIDEYEKNLKQKEESIEKIEKFYEERELNFNLELKRKANEIQKLETDLEEGKKKLWSSETEKKKLEMKNAAIKENVDQLKHTNQDLEKKYEENLKTFHEKMQEMTEQTDTDKAALEEVIKSLREENEAFHTSGRKLTSGHNECSLSNEIEGYNFDYSQSFNNTKGSIRKESSSRINHNETPMKSPREEIKIVSFNLEQNNLVSSGNFNNNEGVEQNKHFCDEENILKAEVNILKAQNENLMGRIEELENRISRAAELEVLNENLKTDMANLKELYEKELEDLKNKSKEILEEQQKVRQNALSQNTFSIQRNEGKEKELTEIIEKYKEELERLQMYILVSKEQWAEENNFLREELKVAEKIAVDAKLQYAQVATDKDTYYHNYKKLLNILKKSKESSKMAKPEGPGRQLSFFKR